MILRARSSAGSTMAPWCILVMATTPPSEPSGHTSGNGGSAVGNGDSIHEWSWMLRTHEVVAYDARRSRFRVVIDHFLFDLSWQWNGISRPRTSEGKNWERTYELSERCDLVGRPVAIYRRCIDRLRHERMVDMGGAYAMGAPWLRLAGRCNRDWGKEIGDWVA